MAAQGIAAGVAAVVPQTASLSGALQRTAVAGGSTSKNCNSSSVAFPLKAGCAHSVTTSTSAFFNSARASVSRNQVVCACAAEQSEPGPSGSRGGEEEEETVEEDDVAARVQGLNRREGQKEEEDDVAVRVQGLDWRAFRARLVQGSVIPDRWAHPLVEPEKGCLLIAHPTAFGIRQPYFNQAVIFLFAHDADGSAGFILNRPTEYKLGQLAGFEKYMPEFNQSPLYMGGDVGSDLTQVIHGVPGLGDSKEIISGVYLGGFSRIKDNVKNGVSKASDYRWFLGYCGWRPGQLEREVAHGVWYLASSSKDIVTDQCIKLERPLWRQVLELMGGQYADISKRAYGET